MEEMNKLEEEEYENKKNDIMNMSYDSNITQVMGDDIMEV